MKVGIVVPYSWSFRGGVVEHAEQQARALNALGVETRIIVGYDPPGRLTRLLHPRPGRDDLPPGGLISIGRSAVVPNNGSFAHIVLSPRASARIRRAFDREQFDVIHLHEPAAPVPCMAALLHADAPLVGTFHASGRVPLYALAKPVFGFLVDRLERRVAVSRQARETAARFFPGEYQIVPNGAPFPERASSRDRRNTITFVGRHDRRKGLAVLLRAWPEIHRCTGARLQIIGADPRAVGPLLGRLRIERGAIDLLGSVSDEELTRELLRTKAVVAPSLGNESFGMVITRAFACATPVVASDIPGYRDVVTSETGVLVGPGETIALAEAVVGLLADERLRAQFGDHARELAASEYSWERIALRLCSIYDDLLAPSRPRDQVA
jgi:phosphatidylinositol alpha-mannosyltransferase